MQDITPEGIKRQIEKGIREGTTVKPFPTLEEVIAEVFKNEPKIGLLSKEEIEFNRHILGNFIMDGLGEEVYQLPGGGLTGKGGWKMFEEAMLEEGKKLWGK